MAPARRRCSCRKTRFHHPGRPRLRRLVARRQEPMADRLLFLTTADTEILAAARAAELLPGGFPEIRCANPVALGDPAAFLEEALPGTRAALVRLLGGRRAWPGGFEGLRRRCVELGVPLLAFGGEAEPDAELTALSTAPSGVVAEAFEYLRRGGVVNTANLLRFVADTLLFEGYGFEPPSPLPDLGVYHPRLGGSSTLEELLALHVPGRPTVGAVFYRTHLLGGNTAFVDALVQALERAGANALPIYCYSLRAGAEGRVPALELLRGRVDALVTTVLASGGSNAADAQRGEGPEGWLEWEVPALEELKVPVVQGICATSSREAWLESDAGLSPLDTAWQVAIPEFDGRIVSVPFSFKERLEADSPVGAPLTLYEADPERTARLAGLAARFARLGRTPNGEKKVAVLLSNYPTKHSRVGNAVGLDTPASAVERLREGWTPGATRSGFRGCRRNSRRGSRRTGGRRRETSTSREGRSWWRGSPSATSSSASSRPGGSGRTPSPSPTTPTSRRPTTTSLPTGGWSRSSG